MKGVDENDMMGQRGRKKTEKSISLIKMIKIKWLVSFKIN